MTQPASLDDDPVGAARSSEDFAREAAAVCEARSELDSGFYVDADDIDAWIDSIGTANELPAPPTRRR